MGVLRKEYRDLEQKIYRELKDAITSSNIKSKHCNEKCIRVKFDNYTEMLLLDNRLLLLDSGGLHYNVCVHAELEDLIDVLENIG